MKNKYKTLFISALIALLLIAVIPKSSDLIDEAVVNPSNGDIAIHYCTSKITTIAVVELYSKDGERLFAKSYNISRALDIAFDGDKLYVLSPDNRIYCYDRDGNDAPVEKNYSEIKEKTLSDFTEWEFGIGKRTYQWEEYEYRYDAPMIFRDRACMTITKAGETYTIYESE